ncbi:uncharacterized protein LOC133836936 [Drosophila sulfurigaster albostrigata]|uniref:Uncharacterized protein LOC117575882 n=1 Tax=Drosophila albomicans TaxID=7291 RepID=A0A6P8XY38_DROAB|nr:uncharacterized protein LOC117575882 [Drosophila albomicans]XP_060648739.1 uncharacterized protein LOC132786267 [Drosophila nasuta]XP_062123535.1 uncharacterized protein LOC133836936 [Drosophila sulfurigaster albostrigata]
MLGLSSVLRRFAILGQVNKLQLATTLRFKSKKCKKGNVEKEKCKQGKFSEFPCGRPENLLVRQPKVNEAKMTKPPSIWLNPFCDEDAPYCPFNPRFDDIYYVESDKAKRKYWQTWVACPPMQIKKKKICCFENIKAAPLRRRTRNKPKTACPQPVDCTVKEKLDCPRFKRRCHRAGRNPPDCVKTKRPLICSKPLTPYPAFSECVRMKPNALPLSECICWKKPMVCEAWAEWRRRSMRKMRKV